MSLYNNNHTTLNATSKVDYLKENIISFLPFYFESLTNAEKRIFSLIYKFNKKYENTNFSIKFLAKQAQCSKTTVHQFVRNWKDVLVKITPRGGKTNLWQIPSEILFYIKNNGGIKIIRFFEAHKKRLIRLGLEDPNCQEFRKSYEQDMNKNKPKTAPPLAQKPHPTIFNDLNTYLDEVLLRTDVIKDEEILMRFGIERGDIMILSHKYGLRYVRDAMQDVAWKKKNGKNIYNTKAYIDFMAKHYTKQYYGVNL